MGRELPFLDSRGNKIFEGSTISQTNFNGEEYTAKYEVVRDPDNCSFDHGGFCLKMIIGNEKAMSSDCLSSFGSIAKGKLRKGVVEQ